MTTGERYVYSFTVDTQKHTRLRYRFMMRYGVSGSQRIMGRHRHTLEEAVKDRDFFLANLKGDKNV